MPNHEVTAFFNLATTALLFGVVWVVLSPILTGEVVLVPAEQHEYSTNINARADNLDYGYDKISESVNNLYKWWTDQYYPGYTQYSDEGYQTNYDETAYDNYDNSRSYDTQHEENYGDYSG